MWIRDIAYFNPVNWAVTGGRDALVSSQDWRQIGFYIFVRVSFEIFTTVLATAAFGAYRRAV